MDIVQEAIHILSDSLIDSETKEDYNSLNKCRDYFRLKIGNKKVETFVVMYMDARYRMIEFQELANGTIDQTNCYPRAITVKALDNCARYVVVGHNHPSGDCTPSNNDKKSTETLGQALSLFDIGLLDHFVIGRAPGFPCWSIRKGEQV